MVTTIEHMNEEDLRKHVFAGLAFVLEKPDEKTFALDAGLHKTLGLQSEDGADLACYLSKALGFEISYRTNLLWEDDKGDAGRLRTVGDLISFLLALRGEQSKS